MNGRRFRTANIIDDFNREALRIRAGFSLPAERVTEFLDEIAGVRGYPNELRVDNGSENISTTMSNWAAKNSVTIKFIQPENLRRMVISNALIVLIAKKY